MINCNFCKDILFSEICDEEYALIKKIIPLTTIDVLFSFNYTHTIGKKNNKLSVSQNEIKKSSHLDLYKTILPLI